MKPKNIKSKIFLDSGDPDETKQTISLLGFLDGQTTNPTLIAKNPEVAGCWVWEKRCFPGFLMLILNSPQMLKV